MPSNHQTYDEPLQCHLGVDMPVKDKCNLWNKKVVNCIDAMLLHKMFGRESGSFFIDRGVLLLCQKKTGLNPVWCHKLSLISTKVEQSSRSHESYPQKCLYNSQTVNTSHMLNMGGGREGYRLCSASSISLEVYMSISYHSAPSFA